jgi:hypothetical protein
MGERPSPSAITFDVRGGFDTILPNRLLKRLADQGWPRHSIRWVSSFLTNRSASMRLDGIRDKQQRLAGSLPQGSPVSPVLCMLFMQPLFSAHHPESFPRAGYADDGKLSAHSSSLEDNCQKLATDFASVLHWCNENQIPLDDNMTSLMHFTRSTKAANPPVLLLDSCLTPHLTPVPKDGTSKWLGVLFDRRLTFRPQVLATAAKANRAAFSLRMLGGCKLGAPANLLRGAVSACIVSVITYAAETWWNPPNSYRRATHTAADRLDKPI